MPGRPLTRLADSGIGTDETQLVYLRGGVPPHDCGEVRGPLPRIIHHRGTAYRLSSYTQLEPDGTQAHSYYPITGSQ